MTISRMDVPIGTVLDYAGASVPSGYLECDGRAVSRTAYAKLFAAIGTAWGAGNGSTTFNLPNLGGRVAIGRGSRTVGTVTSGETKSYTPAGTVGGHTLTNSEIPKHTHAVPAHTHTVSGGKVTDHSGSSGGMSANASHSHHLQNAGEKSVAKGTNYDRPGKWETGATAGYATNSVNLAHTHTINHGHGFTQPTVNGGATTTSEQSSGGGSHNHGFTGTQANINVMQPYAVVRKVIRAT